LGTASFVVAIATAIAPPLSLSCGRQGTFASL
jgi:hypothetical protein